MECLLIVGIVLLVKTIYYEISIVYHRRNTHHWLVIGRIHVFGWWPYPCFISYCRWVLAFKR